MLKKLKPVFYFFFVIFVVIFLLEDACQIYVRFLMPSLMPKYEQLQNPVIAQAEKKEKAKFKASPFFGYVSTEGNNYGFESDEDFPISKSSNTYTVAILGGSVAYYFANYIYKNESFTENMKKAIPSLRNKNIRFMSLALPGYKQPQQHIVLSYFLEQIDMVIQLDGWNEVFVPSKAGSHTDYPAMMDMNDKNGLEKMDRKIKFKALVINTIEDNDLLKKSMALFLLKNSLEYKLFQERQAEAPKDKKAAPAEAIFSAQAQPMVATWSKFIKQEQFLLKAHNKKGFFFVQASQYSPGMKNLTEEEKRVAINPLIKELVMPKFQLIREESKKIGVHDLAAVFKNEKGSIYIDNCCHLNPRGNMLMSEEILRLISKNFNN